MNNPLYVVGEIALLTAAIKDSAGIGFTPDSLTLRVKAPDGTVSTTAREGMTEISAGSVQVDVLLAQAGTYCYRWESAAPVAGAAEGLIAVRKSLVI